MKKINSPEVPLNAGEMPVGARVADAGNSRSDAASGLQPSEAALEAAYRAFDPDGAPFGSYAYHVAVVRAAYAVDFGSRPALAGSPEPSNKAIAAYWRAWSLHQSPVKQQDSQDAHLAGLRAAYAEDFGT